MSPCRLLDPACSIKKDQVPAHVLIICFFVTTALSEQGGVGHERSLLRPRTVARYSQISHDGSVHSKSKEPRSEKAQPRSSPDAFDRDPVYHAPFKLDTKVGKKHPRIPKQLLLTGPFSNFSEVARRRRSAILESWLGLSPVLQINYFNDSSCSAYIKEHYDAELLFIFSSETRGSFRGDICRTAVLLREGGFYIDLDMQLRVPLTELIDDDTTFVTVRSALNGILNALIGTVPDSPVLNETLVQMRKWYRNETTKEWPMGPTTMARGLQQVMNLSCPNYDWRSVSTQFECGENHIRLYSEVSLIKCNTWGRLVCPKKRFHAWFEGVRYGLFSMPKLHLENSFEEKFIGWSRAEDCRNLGCRVSGGLVSP